ncbi:MAG: bifunctional folylpolyglutamate synthase/dihydrofolate synthase [Deltaproteobacteria bacterium]|nr:bifunctional folylpolyglutamate synthase/dihydrofolate synthase [Deltaproteobacteria bacterium]
MDAYSKTLERIYNVRGGVIDLRLDRMDRALALFDHPERSFRSFHIAGTNGKGSTAAMLHRILSLAGYRTALYTSPHLVSFTERIRIADEEIAPEEVVTLADEIWDRSDSANISLTFFEIVTVMAFIYFARRQADVAVVEVGLGGRLDATNLVNPVVSVITTISKDHEFFLGSDLTSIAREKGGIIKQGVPVVCGDLPAEATAAIREIARINAAPFYKLKQNFISTLKVDGAFDYKGANWNFENLSIGLRGRHQRMNAAIAVAALEITREQFNVGETAIRAGLQSVSWPGRMEVMLKEPTVILDGAHNGEGIKALIDEIRDLRSAGRIKLLFAAMEDKDWRLMLSGLAGVIDEIVLTRVSGMERSTDPNQLAEVVVGKLPHHVIPDSPSALEFLIENALSTDIIVIAGSLYLVGDVRPRVEAIARRKQSGKGSLN